MKLNRCILVLSIFLFIPSVAMATGESTASLSSANPTITPAIYGMGIVWQLDQGHTEKDTNHDAYASVEFGTDGVNYISWMNLVRCYDSTNGFDEVSGSLWDLTPGTTYYVKVTYHDPDGGTADGTVSTQQVATHPLPTVSAGHTYWVKAASGATSGSCTETTQCTLAYAQSIAVAGDVVILQPGSYGRSLFTKGGSAGNWVKYTSQGEDKEVIFSNTADDTVEVNAPYIWLNGLTIIRPYGSLQRQDAVNIHASFAAITSCKISVTGSFPLETTPEPVGIWGGSGTTNAYIADNTIIGPRDPFVRSLNGEGIDLQNQGTGNTIRNNTITRFADGISYPGGNCDIFENDVYRNSDDGIECDNSSRNVRVYRNRITNSYDNALSMQNIDGGMPWYFFRNLIIGYRENVIKFPATTEDQTSPNFVFVNNTIINWEHIMLNVNYNGMMCGRNQNNIYIVYDQLTNPDPDYSDQWAPYVMFLQDNTKDWRSNWDANLYDVGSSRAGIVYRAFGTYYDYLVDFKNKYNTTGDTSITMDDGGKNSQEVSKADVFDSIAMTGNFRNAQPIQNVRLKAGSPAIDAGVVVSGITNGYSGSAPDVGYLEYGDRPPVYGPRTLKNMAGYQVLHGSEMMGGDANEISMMTHVGTARQGPGDIVYFTRADTQPPGLFALEGGKVSCVTCFPRRGFRDGPANIAMFDPQGQPGYNGNTRIAVDRSNNIIYVADGYNKRIRKVYKESGEWVVGTFAGGGSTTIIAGNEYGTGHESPNGLFDIDLSDIAAITLDSNGAIWTTNFNILIKIDQYGVVTTVTSLNPSLENVVDLNADLIGNIYGISRYANKVWKYSESSGFTLLINGYSSSSWDGPITNSGTNGPMTVAPSKDGKYVYFGAGDDICTRRVYDATLASSSPGSVYASTYQWDGSWVQRTVRDTGECEAGRLESATGWKVGGPLFVDDDGYLYLGTGLHWYKTIRKLKVN